jgi:hypothetical protein
MAERAGVELLYVKKYEDNLGRKGDMSSSYKNTQQSSSGESLTNSQRLSELTPLLPSLKGLSSEI